jgi:hypothetical protein
MTRVSLICRQGMTVYREDSRLGRLNKGQPRMGLPNHDDLVPWK